jgi:exosortase/archaeosortase family protein
MQNSTSSFRFLSRFIGLFCALYGFNLFYIGITTPGGIYCSFLDQHLNYIKGWRGVYISSTAKVLESTGYIVHTTGTTLKVQDHAGFRLVYSCLGYGIMSFFAAFVLAFPKPLYSRIFFLFTGLVIIQLLNTLRFILMAVFYKPTAILGFADHHDIFNYSLYIILLGMIYLWLNPRLRLFKLPLFVQQLKIFI